MAQALALRSLAFEALRAYKQDFLRRQGLDGSRPLHDTGHLTRCRHPDSPLARGRVLVAGDAAALVDHWSREGISYALRSGDLAGRAAARLMDIADEEVDAVTGDYGWQVTETLGAEMGASRILMGYAPETASALSAIVSDRSGSAVDWTAATMVVAAWGGSYTDKARDLLGAVAADNGLSLRERAVAVDGLLWLQQQTSNRGRQTATEV
ncbi:hypothetical protein ABZ565_33570 [Streptomyces sp. NPDC016469]|uniref:hypothetical protein n=1 Tax=Streptomyces sp. NPDC016469 TaxID=3157191 RepID=UPI0033DB863D